MSLSQSQLQKLGERLKRGVSVSDLRLLDDYRRSFMEASEAVAQAVERSTGFLASQRPGKSTAAILEKLARQSTHLGRIQDIAGCRITVPDMVAQAIALRALQSRFPDGVLRDRRSDPSHGYRAVHLVVRHGERRVEIQIRTALQNRWALLSERLADRFGNAVKYGGGPPEAQSLLQETSAYAAEVEALEVELAQMDAARPRDLGRETVLTGDSQGRAEQRLIAARERLSSLMLSLSERLERR